MSIDINATNPPATRRDLSSGRAMTTSSVPRAHAFFWRVLIAAAVLSITGNATHAILHSPEHVVISAVVAVVPPTTLLAAVHGVAILSKADTQARFTHLFATVLTLLIALGAFRLSFSTLRSLAVFAGIPADEAWLLPLLIEGSMTQATVALLALARSRDSSAHDLRGPTSDMEIARMVAGNRPHEEGWMEVARTICARDPSHRRDLNEVSAILAHHYDDGWNATRIARQINRSRSTVSRIISLSTQLTPEYPGKTQLGSDTSVAIEAH